MRAHTLGRVVSVEGEKASWKEAGENRLATVLGACRRRSLFSEA